MLTLLQSSQTSLSSLHASHSLWESGHSGTVGLLLTSQATGESQAVLAEARLLASCFSLAAVCSQSGVSFGPFVHVQRPQNLFFFTAFREQVRGNVCVAIDVHLS